MNTFKELWQLRKEIYAEERIIKTGLTWAVLYFISAVIAFILNGSMSVWFFIFMGILEFGKSLTLIRMVLKVWDIEESVQNQVDKTFRNQVIDFEMAKLMNDPERLTLLKYYFKEGKETLLDLNSSKDRYEKKGYSSIPAPFIKNKTNQPVDNESETTN